MLEELLAAEQKYGFSTQRSHKASSERSCIAFKIERPAMSSVGSGG